MAEPLAPLSELPFFAANRKGLRHGAKVTKKANQMKSEKKFLVTGPTGATGGETVEQLLEKGYAVRALAHREDERSERLRKLGAEVVFGDLLDMEVPEVGSRKVDIPAAGPPVCAGWRICGPIRSSALG